MKTEKLTVNRVFDSTERLEVPLFQRPYVWKQEENWEPLWEALQALAEKRIQEVPKEVPVVRPHFMGAVVLDQLNTQMGQLHARQIIDGQQRLTTLQLALAAVRDICYELEYKKFGDAFSKLTDNDVPLSDDPDDKFKVWPTNADREEFRKVMTAKSLQEVRCIKLKGKGLLKGAYLYFAECFDYWLKEKGNGETLPKRIEVLYSTIKEDLYVVVIDLDADDDAQEIFETLNALGTPLLPADLVKNFLFRLAQSQKDDAEKLYKMHWETFDNEKSYWREEIRQGRFKRARLDLFLKNFLTLKNGKEIVISEMFNAYRDLVNSKDGRKASGHMEEFRAYAEVYQSFDNFPQDSREAKFFYRLQELDTTTVYPLLLEIFKRYGRSDDPHILGQVLTDLESFLVRRAVCELTPKNYNKLFAQMIQRLRDNNDNFTPAAVRQLLQAETSEVGQWPDDREFRDKWLTVRFYKRVKKSAQRMILEAINAALEHDVTEKVKIQGKLQIEHLLPVKWEEHWPLVIQEETTDAQEKAHNRRAEMLHRIGNLTLVTRKLNPSLSNGPWIRKRDAILKHSALNLNRTFLEISTWNEDRIEQRSKELFDVAVKVWPYPAKAGN